MGNLNSETTVLVTGGSGFVGVHCIAQLLHEGYQVRTTLRSINKQGEVIKMVQVAGASPDRLQFVQADLTADDNWDLAMKHCAFVLHVASPIFLRAPKSEAEMVRPAVDGTLRVLKAARNAGVKRVVMTSNFGAVGYSHTDTSKVITEQSWTNPNEKGLSVYNKSKTLAEMAAWDFIKREGGTLELSVINPVGIFGPALGPALSSGFELLKKVLDGSMKRVPNITLGIVDVRDVADLHLRAMVNPAAKGERFLAIAGPITSLPEVAHMLKKKVPAIAKNASLKTVPDWVIRIAAFFNPVAKNIAPMLSRYRDASNEKARRLLGWNPRSNETALIAAAESLAEYGALKNIR